MRAPAVVQAPTLPSVSALLGQYAAAWHLPDERDGLTAAVHNWRRYWPERVPLPHPSPLNNGWLVRNAWFEEALVPLLQARVAEIRRS